MAANRPGLTVDNLVPLVKTFNHAPADVKKAFRGELRTVALPIQRDTESLSKSRIRRMRLSPAWAETRIGVTQKSVYVAPKKRGKKTQVSRRRPNLKVLLLDRSFDPALDRNRDRISRDFGHVLDKVVTQWGREGP